MYQYKQDLAMAYFPDHIKTDKVSKFIKKCFVSAASLHDSQALDYLSEESDKEQSLHADSAYVGQGVSWRNGAWSMKSAKRDTGTTR